MRNRLVIIGLDGGTFKIIDPLIEAGKLPNLEKLIKGGTRATLKSTIPYMTPPAWVSFMTGMNPGKHGIFEFERLKEITYEPRLPSVRPREAHTLLHSRYYAGNTLWDILSRAGYKVSVLMMPMTYPAWEVNGYMLAGFPSPDFKSPDAYPPEWGTEIGPLFDISEVAAHNEAGTIKECKQLIKKVGGILLKQLKEAECDVYSIVFSSTDLAQHHLWKYLADKSSPYSSAIPEIYMEADKVIGEILESVDNDSSSVVVLSDHGFAPTPKKRFCLNAWLIKEGYLSLKNKTLTSKAVDRLVSILKRQKLVLKELLKKYSDYLPNAVQKTAANRYYKTDRFEWSRTKAFRYRIDVVEGIVINRKGKYPSGIVEEKGYEALRDEIIERLKNLSDPESGTKVVKEIYKKEELYKGKFLERVPDIMVVLHENYRGVWDIGDGSVIAPGHQSARGISGAHDRDGILILKGPKFKQDFKLERAELVDLLPTIMFDMELPIPKYVDGRVLREAFEEPFGSLPVSYSEDELTEEDFEQDLSQEDEEAMKEALQGLGYLD